MFYYLNKWLFILTTKNLVKSFKSGVTPGKNRTLSSRAEKINKYLFRYLSDLNEAIEYPAFKLIDVDKKTDLYISRIPQDIRDRCNKFCSEAIDSKGEEFSFPEMDIAGTLLFFDINNLEDGVSLDSFGQDAQRAADKLVDGEYISLDCGDHQQT